MSLLTLATQENATGKVKKIFIEIQEMLGMLPNGISLWSINPDALKEQWESIKLVLSKDIDVQKLHAIIRYLVSDENQCTYCTGFNKSMLLNHYELSHEQIASLHVDLDRAPLNNKNKALLKFAMKSVKNADSISKKDVDELKELEIPEVCMFNIVKAASHMYVVNTLFKTFKVQND